MKKWCVDERKAHAKMEFPNARRRRRDEKMERNDFGENRSSILIFKSKYV